MLEQLGQALRFDAFYTASKVGVTGLTVTCDVYDYNGTKVVTAGSATEIGGGLYSYSMASNLNTAKGNYRAIFKTATTTVDQQHIPALWVSGLTWTERIDAAISAIPAAVWAALTSGLTTVGSIGKRISDYLTGDAYARLGAPAGASIAADVASVQADTDNIQTRLPAALVSGRIDASVGAMAADTLTASALASDGVSEIQSGLASGADTTTLLGRLTAQRAANLDLLDVEVTTRATLGAGGISYTYTLTRAGSGTPIDDAAIWVTTDSAGTNVVASGRTNASGQVTFMLDAATYYVWRRKAGWNFTNPQEVVVS